MVQIATIIKPMDGLASLIDRWWRAYATGNATTRHKKAADLRRYVWQAQIRESAQITQQSIQRHLCQMSSNYGHSAIRQSLTAIFQFCEFLVAQGIMSKNHALGCKNPARCEKKPPHYLTDELIDIVYKSARKHNIYSPVLLALKEGLTIAEIALIRWECMMFESRLVQTYRGKTGKVRTIPMHSMVYDHFYPIRQPDGYVFTHRKQRPGKGTAPYCVAWYHQQLDKVQKDVPQLRGWHDLRRTFAVRLAKSPEVSLWDLKNYLGHSKIQTTEIYAGYQPCGYNANIENA